MISPPTDVDRAVRNEKNVFPFPSRWFLSVTPVFVPLATLTRLAEDFVYFLLNGIAMGLFNLVSNLFTGLIYTFLFFKSPAEVGGLEEMYVASLFAFGGIVFIGGLNFIGVMQLFPDSPKLSPDRYFVRLFAALVAVLLGMDLLPQLIDSVNALAKFIWPSEFGIQFAQGGLTDFILNAVGGGLAFLVAAIILYLTSIVTVLALLAILAIRALLVYSVYALFPIFMALWVVDVGPMKYGAQVAELAFKGLALLLAFGLLIAGILATGAAIAGDTSTVPAEWHDIKKDRPVCDPGGSDGEKCKPKNDAIIKLIAFFGSLWASIAVGSSALGMLISIRGSAGGGARAVAAAGGAVKSARDRIGGRGGQSGNQYGGGGSGFPGGGSDPGGSVAVDRGGSGGYSVPLRAQGAEFVRRGVNVGRDAVGAVANNPRNAIGGAAKGAADKLGGTASEKVGQVRDAANTWKTDFDNRGVVGKTDKVARTSVQAGGRVARPGVAAGKAMDRSARMIAHGSNRSIADTGKQGLQFIRDHPVVTPDEFKPSDGYESLSSHGDSSHPMGAEGALSPDIHPWRRPENRYSDEYRKGIE